MYLGFAKYKYLAQVSRRGGKGREWYRGNVCHAEPDAVPEAEVEAEGKSRGHEEHDRIHLITRSPRLQRYDGRLMSPAIASSELRAIR